MLVDFDSAGTCSRPDSLVRKTCTDQRQQSITGWADPRTRPFGSYFWVSMLDTLLQLDVVVELRSAVEETRAARHFAEHRGVARRDSMRQSRS